MREVDLGRRARANRASRCGDFDEKGGGMAPSGKRACYLLRPYLSKVVFQSAANASSASFAVPWPAVM